MKFKYLMLLLSLFVGFSSLQVHANPAEGPIVPGHSLGKLELGMTRQQIEQILGEPATMRRHDKGYNVAIWIHNPKHESDDTTAVYYQDGKAFYMEVISPKFSGPGGVNTSSPLASVIAGHAKLKTSAFRMDLPQGGSFDGYFYDDLQAGITFGIWPDNYFDHSRTIDVIGVHQPNASMPTPIYGTPIEQTLNKPPKPIKIPTGPNSMFSKDGLPLTENVSPDGARGYSTKPIIMDNNIGFFGVGVTSFRGRKVPPTVMLVFMSFSAQPRWLGETYVTLSFGNRHLRLQGEKSTEQLENGATSEHLQVVVPTKDFLALSQGGSLYFQIGDGRFMIDKKYLAGLRALRSKVAAK